MVKICGSQNDLRKHQCTLIKNFKPYNQLKWRMLSDLRLPQALCDPLPSSGRPKENFCYFAETRKRVPQKSLFLQKYRKNQKKLFLPKETLSAGKSFHSCLIISKFWLIKTILFLISAKHSILSLTTQGFST